MDRIRDCNQDKRIKKGLTDLQGYESNNLNLA